MFSRTLAATSAAVAATAVLGSAASADVQSPWYAGLRKPAIQPPGIVFPFVWTALYTDIAVSSAVVIDRLQRSDPAAASAYRRALGVNLVLNASWSWVFFKAHRVAPAIAVAGALAASSADLARRADQADPHAAWALAPYAAWCSFATVLSTAIWRLNR
jgi:benzodiazapine receptor